MHEDLDPDLDLARALLPDIIGNPYIPWFPNPAQAAALCCAETEILYGGAAGGGKSVWILMAALRYVEVPGYAALLLRKTFTDLSEPGALIPMSHEWLANTDAHWNGTKMHWSFPNGSVLSFGYLTKPHDELRYQGAQYTFIGIDELTHHREMQYRYLFSRLRRPMDGPLSSVPLRMYSTSNPGGPGHGWVKRDFMDSPMNPETGEARRFIPAKIADNPKLDVEAYRRSLARLDPITRKQLEDGDWTARHGGSMWRKEWFEIVSETYSSPIARRCRGWDLAASESEEAKRTAGVKVAFAADGNFYIEHCDAFKATPGKRDARIVQNAQTDGRSVRIRLEQEPGSGGIAQTDAIIRMLTGYAVRAERPSGDKFTRMGPWASAAEAGRVKIVDGNWDIAGFLDELEAANPTAPHGGQYLDRIDAMTSAMEELSGGTSLLGSIQADPRRRKANRGRVLDNMGVRAPQ